MVGVVKNIAHRGFGSGPLENTIEAVNRAIALGVDGIEIDVHETRDGEIVVFHDFIVDRKTDGKGAVADLLLKEVQALDLGAGRRIPTLLELIGIVRKVPGLLVNIEIKPENIEEGVLNMIREEGISEQVVISSYHHSVLERVRELEQSIQTALIYKTAILNPIRLAQRLNCSAIAPQFSLISKEFVTRCKRAGVIIFPWAVNDEKDMERMVGWKVDGLITDYPWRLQQLLKQFGI